VIKALCKVQAELAAIARLGTMGIADPNLAMQAAELIIEREGTLRAALAEIRAYTAEQDQKMAQMAAEAVGRLNGTNGGVQ
jgi:hypothetical protein